MMDSIQQDYAYGLIPIWQPQDDAAEQSRRYLLILHQKGHWAFPKGHQEPGETALETACREVKEETGLTDYQVISDRSFLESYRFKSPKGKTIAKTVTYFVAIVNPTANNTHPEIKIQWAEVSDFKWCTYTEALDCITFEANRQVLKDCEAFLNTRKG